MVAASLYIENIDAICREIELEREELLYRGAERQKNIAGHREIKLEREELLYREKKAKKI